MFKKTRICTGLALAFGSGLFVGVTPAIAQDAAQRVEITGSSVRRIDAEAALPVQVLTREDIARTGATSVTDLIRKLPTVQGGIGESGSVGGSSFGFSSISIHNIGDTRTLVLLNGHRLAQFGGQTLTGFAAGFDLNSLPVSAIERVEILTDGASAIYGADAIAGVVNFITRRNVEGGDVTVGYSSPAGGAKETRFSITGGFGSQEKNGFNLFATYSHDTRTKLDSTSRDFAKSGKVLFSENGKNYRFQQFSGSAIPANTTDDSGKQINPNLIATGACAPMSFRVTDGAGDRCGFDFVSTLEIYPERTRDSGIASLTKTIGDHELFADILYAQTTQTSRIAPVPGSISIPVGSDLFNKYLAPLGITTTRNASYRIYDLGKRTSDDKNTFLDIALGSRGMFAGWDYNAAYTHSESDVKGNISGYPGAIAIANLRKSGKLDPFVGIGQQSAEGNAALAAANYSGYWDGGTSKLDTINVRGSKEIAKMPAGALMLGTGVNYNREAFTSKPSLFAQGLLSDPVAGTLCDPVNAPELCDQRFGDSSSKPPYSASRNSFGIFGELIIPVTTTLEAGAALRFDRYSDFGNATTGKASFKWTPDKTWLVRGSVGTGFKAPSVPQVDAAETPYGVTSDKYSCTPALQAQATAQGAVCQPGEAQYDQKAGGNKGLQPEKSVQGTLGIRFEPTPAMSFGADLWHVGINDAIGQLPEGAVFANPGNFPTAWTSNKDVGTGTNYLAFLATNGNLGKYFATGIDFDVTGKTKTSVGDLSTQFTMTYMLREDQQIEKNGAYYSAIGINSPDLTVVTFKYQGRWSTTLKTGNFGNTLALNFKSGYTDQQQTVDVLDSSGAKTGTEDLTRHVKSYYSFDYNGSYDFNKTFGVSFGILNLFDQAPPFSLVTVGANKGQQFGYDDRYYDPRGRTYFANLQVRF